jgi:hypothetical protein
MSINTTELELVMNKSKLLDNETCSDEDLEEIMVLMENDSQLNRKDIFDLIIKEDISFIFNIFGVVWTFLDQYNPLLKNLDLLVISSGLVSGLLIVNIKFIFIIYKPNQ